MPPIVHGFGGGRARRQCLDELPDQIGLPRALADHLSASLSGGQRQRAVIACALATSPDILVLNEPTSSLDVSVRARI